MNRQNAEKIIEKMTKPLYGFALKSCKNLQDAEDLTQEIVLKAFRALTLRENLSDAEKYVWSIAHNALADYYRDNQKIYTCMKDRALKDKLIELGKSVRKDCAEILSRLKEPYEKAILRSTPPHMKKARAFLLQSIFCQDGIFLICILQELLKEKKLLLPPVNRRGALMSVLFPL